LIEAHKKRALCYHRKLEIVRAQIEERSKATSAYSSIEIAYLLGRCGSIYPYWRSSS